MTNSQNFQRPIFSTIYIKIVLRAIAAVKACNGIKNSTVNYPAFGLYAWPKTASQLKTLKVVHTATMLDERH